MNAIGSIYVAGHRGMVGQAIVRRLAETPSVRVITEIRENLDLTNQAAVNRFFERHRPTQVIMAAARVGGILANQQYPADFIRDNLAIELNLIDAAHRFDVEKLLMLGSSCIYPKLAPQPIPETALLSGPLEPTNAPYAVAKIAGIIMAQSYARQYNANFISAMPTNLYGPYDNFDLSTSHVIPALIRKIHVAHVTGADSVEVWGTGDARREFLHVDDLADASIFLMRNYDAAEIINVGTGRDITIRELATLIQEVVGFKGTLVFDPNRPEGPPRKLLDSTKLTALGWAPKRALRAGIAETYAWFRRQGSEFAN